MKESTIEAQLVKLVNHRGGRAYKWVSPGNAGVPDRIVITSTGRVIFVELKTEVGRLSPVQVMQHERLRALGVDVRTLYGLDQVKAFVTSVFSENMHVKEVMPK